jgi:hypothetical protein
VELLFDRGDGKTQIMETPILRFPRIPPVAIEPTEQRTDAIVPVKGVETQGTAGTVTVQATGHTTRIELSNKRQAVFSIPDSLTKRDAQKLKSALRGFEAIIDSMISEETDGAPRLP